MATPIPQKPTAATAPAAKNGVLEVSKKPLSEVVANLPLQDTTTPTLASVTPKTTAIYKVDSALSQAYTHVHTPLLLSLFAANFNALVQSPVATLAYTTPVLAALQASYCGICLQPTTLSSGKKANKKKKKLAGPLVGQPGAAARPVTPVKKAPTHDVALITMVCLLSRLYHLWSYILIYNTDFGPRTGLLPRRYPSHFGVKHITWRAAHNTFTAYAVIILTHLVIGTSTAVLCSPIKQSPLDRDLFRHRAI